MIDDLRGAKPKGFEVWPDNMPIVDLWLAIASQWTAIALANGRVHWLGLDYSAVRDGFALAGMAVDSASWAGVRVMERAATDALNGAG